MLWTTAFPQRSPAISIYLLPALPLAWRVTSNEHLRLYFLCPSSGSVFRSFGTNITQERYKLIFVSKKTIVVKQKCILILLGVNNMSYN